MTNSITTTKAALRKQILARRDALSAVTRAALSARITKRLAALESFQQARTVLAYMSMGSEFDTRDFIDAALAQGKALLLPRVDRGTRALSMHRVIDLQSELQPGTWGILEPRENYAVASPNEADWILVPGLAFTVRGERLGYGAGYYDKLIAGLHAAGAKPALAAAAFGVQLTPELPVTATDQNVDVVVTEDAVYER